MTNFIEKLGKIHLPIFSSFHIAADLGTSYTRLAIKDKGVVLRESTVVGFNKKTHEYIFFGNEARSITGKVPEFIKIENPVVNGIISNFDGEVAMVDKYIKKSVLPYLGKYPLIKPGIQAHVAVPSIATEIEQKAVEEVMYKTGASYVSLYEKPLATAIGSGLNIFIHQPIFIIDMGGGLIEIAIISGGGIVLQKSLKTAGEHMNKLIYNYLYLKHGIILGEITCDELKTKLLNFVQQDNVTLVRGKSLETGLPKSIKVKSSDIKEALLSSFNQIIDTVKEIIELAPPEVVDEVYKNGVVLTGGLSNIPGIETFFIEELKIPAKLADNRDNTTINGVLRICRRKEHIQRLRLQLP